MAASLMTAYTGKFHLDEVPGNQAARLPRNPSKPAAQLGGWNSEAYYRDSGSRPGAADDDKSGERDRNAGFLRICVASLEEGRGELRSAAGQPG